MGKNSNLAVVTTSDHWQKVPQASAAAFTVPADGDRLGRELYVVGDDMNQDFQPRHQKLLASPNQRALPIAAGLFFNRCDRHNKAE